MKVSMNGLRKNLSYDFIDLLESFKVRPSKETIDCLDNIRDYIATLNLVYSEVEEDVDSLDIDIPFPKIYFKGKGLKEENQ